jgi:DNA polymerase-1
MLEDVVWPKLLELEAEARRLAGKPTLNLNSPTQLQQLYYDEWGLVHDLRRPKKESKGKRSADKLVRQEILEGRYTASKDKTTVDYFTRTLDRHSELDTQRTNFFESLARRQWPDGRIYYTLLIHGTETGRLSGRNPNTQNITRPKEGLPPIRNCFVADPGHVILNCDLSQAELRAIAQLSGDSSLMGIYRDSSRSLHREVAEQFYGANYTGEQYVYAKNINFGVVYQQSAYSFAQLYGMDIDEADEFIKWWWKRFPKVQEWTQEIKRQVLTDGEIQSPFGHKRRFYLVTNQNKDHLVKEGINFLPQNIAANITLAALIEICKTIDWTTCQPKTSVHDSIVLHVKTSHVEEVAHYVLDVMESIPKKKFGWDLPFTAEAKYGPDWGHTDTEVKR